MNFPIIFALLSLVSHLTLAQETGAPPFTLEYVKKQGALRSSYRTLSEENKTAKTPRVDLKSFHSTIQPILTSSCVECHGPDRQRAKFRIDTLDPDLINGEDADWWLEVVDVLSNDEMPPEDEGVEMADKDRAAVVDWLSQQIQVASQVERSAGKHSSFRRMTRYEFNYALQDLLGLSQNFAADLPPETKSEDGFQNSSEMLQMTSQQFTTYRDIARTALNFATVRGPKPEPTYFSITMDKAGPYFEEWITSSIESLRNRKQANPELGYEGPWKFVRAKRGMGRKGFAPNKAHFLNRETGDGWERNFPYGYSPWQPTQQEPSDPEIQPFAMVLPQGTRHLIDLGNSLPDRGMVRIRFRANRASAETHGYPNLRLSFGYKPGNNSSHDYIISEKNIEITATPDQPNFYEWIISMNGISRNPYLRIKELGMNPNSSEHISIRNVSQGRDAGATAHIDYIEVTTSFVTEWPPQSHRRIFLDGTESGDERSNARIILANFMPKAWRRPVSEKELELRISLFQKIRPTFEDFQETMIEVLASVISSPNFLYLSQSSETITDSELATRLSFFLWSSQPDEELTSLVTSGKIREPGVLVKQAERLLTNPRADRFTQNFTHQWLSMELLDLFQPDKKTHPTFSKELKRSMLQEPIEFFKYVLKENRSVMDFLHADYALLDQNLAHHYRENHVLGNHFQKVALHPESKRGGLLAQAGLLAMNSDGNDSNPLKRGIWILESLLNDPPPPAPPAVPQIDLADPRILKMTLKERMEDHRNHPACMSCHSKIDPWGIALEEFDAIGAWREQIDGKPVDATSHLYNKSKLAGMDGLKRYLLENRQDQFARAMVHKMASYALGRPLSFADRAEVEQITKMLRQEGDGLRTLIRLLVESRLFQKH